MSTLSITKADFPREILRQENERKQNLGNPSIIIPAVRLRLQRDFSVRDSTERSTEASASSTEPLGLAKVS
jgi:hypothetical protein